MKLLLLVLLSQLQSGKSGKILFYVPFSTRSVQITFISLAETLEDRGHDVLLVSPYPSPRLKNQLILNSSLINDHFTSLSQNQLNPESYQFLPFFDMIKTMREVNGEALNSTIIQSYLLDDSTSFDVVFAISFFMAETGYYLAHKFNAHLILYSSIQCSAPFMDRAIGQDNNPAFMPSCMLPYGPEMTFKERLINTIVSFLFDKIIKNRVFVEGAEDLLDTYLPSPHNIRSNRPSLRVLEEKASLVMSFGSPFLLDGWRPTSHNYVTLGMMNCKRPNFDLIEPSLREFLNNAKEGFIFFSLGTAVKSSAMSESRRKTFLNVFRKLKMKVLMKWENEILEDKPKNVEISSWLPQQEILAHPNMKLFLSHGGQSSFQETLCHKKPALFIPVHGDQLGNANEGVRKGFAKVIHYNDITEANLLEAIESMSRDSSYTENAIQLSNLLLDDINQPMERAIWWIEYLFRHKNLSHFSSPSKNLFWFQYYLLDVYLFMCLIIFLISYSLFKLCICIWTQVKQSTKSMKKD